MMVRRARRPHWSSTDNPALLAALKEARAWSVKFGSGHTYDSGEYRASHEANVALDTLAYVITGDPNVLIPENDFSRIATPAGPREDG